MKRSLRKRIILLFLGFILLLNILMIVMNYWNFASLMENSGQSTASTVAETCALIIDGDTIEDYIKSGQRDTAYYTTWNKLLDYRNTNSDIVNLSVVWFDEEGGHYIYDTDLTARGAFLGDKVGLDLLQLEQKDTLIDGEKTLLLTYPNRVEFYRPVLSSYNISMGYVIVGISMEAAEQANREYLLKVIAIVVALTAIITIIYLLSLNRTVINPINQLSAAVASYVDSMDETGGDSPLAGLSIHTGDEIENLFHSVRKMEFDILNSSNNLAVALWNSHHDSMTQLYNKRYLAERTEEYLSQKTLGVVYFDVDNLKKMNDICGHEAGDEVIKKTADFIRAYQEENHVGYRMGGDEFMMVVTNISSAEMAALVARMKADAGTRLTPPESEVQCRIAIGYSFGWGTIDLDKLMQEADQDMYKDKQSHR